MMQQNIPCSRFAVNRHIYVRVYRLVLSGWLRCIDKNKQTKLLQFGQDFVLLVRSSILKQQWLNVEKRLSHLPLEEARRCSKPS